MPQIDPKGLKNKLKKGEIDNIYYLFGENVPEVDKLTKMIIKAAVGDNEDIALTSLEGRYLDFSELSDMIMMMPIRIQRLETPREFPKSFGFTI